MSFQEPIFIFTLLPAALCVSLMTDGLAKKLATLILSLLYAFWFSNATLIYLIFLTVLLYGYGRFSQSFRRFGNFAYYLAISILFLGFFWVRYPENIISAINKIAGISIFSSSGYLFFILGISFITFKAASYLVEIRRKIIKPEKNFLLLANFLTFFPVITAGPIVRYSEFTSEYQNRSFNYQKQLPGIRRFIGGFAKKIIIADSLAKFVNLLFEHSSYLSAGTAWLGAIMFTLQIYYDFSGYSDMAIGLSRMLGYQIPENFNQPYYALSLREFWRRWHMTLMRWFRDIIYIPLGGNRKGTIRRTINLIIVFFLTGLWHGQTLPFIIWGLANGMVVAGETMIFKHINIQTPAILKRLYTFFLIINFWVIFRSGTMDNMITYFVSMYRMTGATDPRVAIYLLANSRWLLTLLVSSISLIIFSEKTGRLDSTKKPIQGRRAFLQDMAFLIIFLLSLSFAASQTHLPFLYEKF